jgi:diacylglycerol kinase family enzyme
MEKRARVFLNEGSGAGGCSAQQVAGLFAERDWKCEFSLLGSGASVGELARNEDAQVVFVAAGGDGTVNAVASAVAGTERCMGVLPVGTLNHFAHDLGLPLKLEAAVAAITGGRTRGIDVAEVNGAVFVNNSSIGAYPTMVLDRERMRKSGTAKSVYDSICVRREQRVLPARHASGGA